MPAASGCTTVTVLVCFRKFCLGMARSWYGMEGDSGGFCADQSFSYSGSVQLAKPATCHQCQERIRTRTRFLIGVATTNSQTASAWVTRYHSGDAIDGRHSASKGASALECFHEPVGLRALGGSYETLYRTCFYRPPCRSDITYSHSIEHGKATSIFLAWTGQ